MRVIVTGDVPVSLMQIPLMVIAKELPDTI